MIFFSHHHNIQEETTVALGQRVSDVRRCLLWVSRSLPLCGKMAAATRHGGAIQGRRRSEITVYGSPLSPLLRGQIFPRNPEEFQFDFHRLCNFVIPSCKICDMSIWLGTLPQKTKPEFYQQGRRGAGYWVGDSHICPKDYPHGKIAQSPFFSLPSPGPPFPAASVGLETRFPF